MAAIFFNKPRSVFITETIPGLIVLITTLSPVFRVAAYTCAMEADARGVSSMSEKISADEGPR